MESGFEFVNKHAGGYQPGTVTVVRTLEQEGGALQDFIISETKQIGVENQVPVLVLSLGMDTKEFAKCLALQESKAGIERLIKARLYVADKEKETSFRDLLKDLEQAVENIEDELGLVIIDDIGSVIRGIPTKESPLDNSQLISLVNLAKKTRLPILVSDYENNLETGYPRPDEVVEIELLTDLQKDVQAALYKGKDRKVTTDLYENWRVFEAFLKDRKHE